MGLPDLLTTIQVISEAAVGAAAHAADGAAGIPPAPALPLPGSALPAGDLGNVLVNLGGWGTILWWCVSAAFKRLETIGDNLGKAVRDELGSLKTELRGDVGSLTAAIKRNNRELRQLRREQQYRRERRELRNRRGQLDDESDLLPQVPPSEPKK